jgi:hypothetical protein
MPPEKKRRIDIRSGRKVWVNGEPFAPVKDLSRICHLSPNHLATLARTEQVDAVRLAGAWYLSLKSLASLLSRHNSTKER